MDFTVAGQSVFAATGGQPFDSSLPAIVFVHGAGMDHTVWALQTRYFSHHGRGVLAIDLPGHGRSEGDALASIEAIADWLADLITATGCETAALVGHSMGAIAALECAARYPKRVRSLGLLGVAPKMPVHPDLLAAAEADDHRALGLITDWGHGRAAHLGGHPAPGLWILGGGERLLERARPGVLHLDLAACNDYTRGEQSAADISCPALLVLGGDDLMTPARAGRKLAGLIPEGRSLTIPRAGHMMMIERSDETLDALRDFL